MISIFFVNGIKSDELSCQRPSYIIKIFQAFSGFDWSFWSAAVKIYPFATVKWWIKMKKYSSKILPGHRTIYLLQLLKTNLLSETTVSQAQQTFICSNSAKFTVEQSAK